MVEVLLKLLLQLLKQLVEQLRQSFTTQQMQQNLLLK